MDSRLHEAAVTADVEFLKKALATKPSEYFLALGNKKRSILHLATMYERVEFMKEAKNILPTNIFKQLFLMTSDDSNNLLHTAAIFTTNVLVIKYLREMYESLSLDDPDLVKPWLALTDFQKKTPLSLSLDKHYGDEAFQMEIMLIDPEQNSWIIADAHGNTPLYYAVKNGYNLVAEKILMSPHGPTSLVSSKDFSPGNAMELLKKFGYLDNDGNTALHSALHSKSTEELALQTLSSTDPAWFKICNDKGESPFFLAVKSGCEQFVDRIIGIEEPRFEMLLRSDGTTVLHYLSSCTEKIGLILLEKFWWLMNLRDSEGKTALDYAKQEKTIWLVNLLTNPNLIIKQDFDWLEAYKRKEIKAVHAFIDTCPDFERICRKGHDTLLHHVVLPTYKDYLNFLKIPSIAELKNTTDSDGTTPLHRALERGDINFARALLSDNEVDRIIRDNDGTTSMDLLAMNSFHDDEWDQMCKDIKVNPFLRTTYILPGTNLAEMRSTLSVIAALLATITFAAGFTLPGGLNEDGQALFVKKAAFIVFLLADVYAMCTSILVLFCLVWSMVSEPDMARLLIDRSVFILMHSLYATLLAFMTGVYTVIEHGTLWAAIIIFVMCSVVGISANRTILHKVIAFFVPAIKGKVRDQIRMLEEGHGGMFGVGVEERSCCCILHHLKSLTKHLCSSIVHKYKNM